MERLRFKPYTNFICLAVIIALVVSKSWLRPWARRVEAHEYVQIFLGSFPNFLEALIGMVALTGIIMAIRHNASGSMARLKDASIYLMATALAAIYVITQEVKLHSIGGTNVYDPYDVAASIIGLLFINAIFFKFGFIREASTSSELTPGR